MQPTKMTRKQLQLPRWRRWNLRKTSRSASVISNCAVSHIHQQHQQLSTQPIMMLMRKTQQLQQMQQSIFLQKTLKDSLANSDSAVSHVHQHHESAFRPSSVMNQRSRSGSNHISRLLSMSRKAQKVIKPKPHLLSIPGEILNQILTSLLVHPHSIAFPTFDDNKFPGLRPHDPPLSPSVLSICQLSHEIGNQLFYGGNVFNSGAHHRIRPLASPSAGFTLIRAPSMSLITQLGAQIEPLLELFHFDKLWKWGSNILNELAHFYPGDLNKRPEHTLCIAVHRIRRQRNDEALEG